MGEGVGKTLSHGHKDVEVKWQGKVRGMFELVMCWVHISLTRTTVRVFACGDASWKLGDYESIECVEHHHHHSTFINTCFSMQCEWGQEYCVVWGKVLGRHCTANASWKAAALNVQKAWTWVYVFLILSTLFGCNVIPFHNISFGVVSHWSYFNYFTKGHFTCFRSVQVICQQWKLPSWCLRSVWVRTCSLSEAV